MNSAQLEQPLSISQSALTAKAILSSARAEAKEIITAARQEALQIISRAKVKSVLEDERRESRNRISSLLAWRKAVITAKEDLLLIVEHISRSVLSTELSSSPTSILNRIEEVETIVDDLTSATLELSEDDISKIKDLLSSNGHNVKSNSSLSTGEFIVRTKLAEIKSSPHYYLQNLIEEFKNSSQTFHQLSKSILSTDATN